MRHTAKGRPENVRRGAPVFISLGPTPRGDPAFTARLKQA